MDVEEGQTIHSNDQSSAAEDDSSHTESNKDSTDETYSSPGGLKKFITVVESDNKCENEDPNAPSSLENSKYNSIANTGLKLPSPGISFLEYQMLQKEGPNLTSKRKQTAKSRKKKSKKKMSQKLEMVSEGNIRSYRGDECSICLGLFSEGENVSWSAIECEHIFHQECILNWLMTKGRQSLANNSNDNVLQIRLCRYRMQCPICRQDFIPNAGE